jgi:tetratricopeptide (TPR) repeat protein
MLKTKPHEAVFKAIVGTEMASFYDHTGQPATALKILEDLLTQPGAKSQYAEQYWWWQYQKGIMLRQLGQYDPAREVLEKVHTVFESDPTKDYAASALHQLGVLELELGRYTEAEARFKTCLEKRRPDRSNHRAAYEYRRLAQLYARTSRHRAARAHVHQAIAIAQACGFERYLREIKQDRQLLPYL